jgi:hypothetical protein
MLCDFGNERLNKAGVVPASRGTTQSLDLSLRLLPAALFSVKNLL